MTERLGDLQDAELLGCWTRDSNVLARDLYLLRKWRAGDADAGLELLAYYMKYFYRVCREYGLIREEEVREAFQEVVLGLIEGLDTLPDRIERSFAGFFAYRIRSAIVRLRKARAPAGSRIEETIPAQGTPRVEIREAIMRCRDRLPRREQEVFDGRFLLGMRLKEIASALGSNVNAVGQAAFRAVRKMRECLKKAGF